MAKKKKQQKKETIGKITTKETLDRETLVYWYNKTQLHCMKWSYLCDHSRINIWEEDRSGSEFVKECMDEEWLKTLKKRKMDTVMGVIVQFQARYSNTAELFTHLKHMTITEVSEKLKDIAVCFGFGSNLNDDLGLKFEKEKKAWKNIIEFKHFQRVIESVVLRRQHHIRDREFMVTMMCKLLRLYVVCLVDVMRELYDCKDREGSVLMRRRRRHAIEHQSMMTPNLEVDGIEILNHRTYDIWPNDTFQVSPASKWLEKFIGWATRIELKELTRTSRNIWFKKILVPQPDMHCSFTSSFLHYNSYNLPTKGLEYLRKVHDESLKNLRALVADGEFGSIVREIMKDCMGDNSFRDHEELHEVLGKVVEKIGTQVFKVENRQILTNQLKSFVKNISRSCYFVFCEDNTDLVEGFDPDLEAHLVRLVEGCSDFEEALHFMKCAIIRFVLRFAVHVLRNVVCFKLENREIEGFSYDGTFEFELSSTSSTPPQSTPIMIHRANGNSDITCVDVENSVRTEARSSEQSEISKKAYRLGMMKMAEEDNSLPREYLEIMREIFEENDDMRRKLNEKRSNNCFSKSNNS